MKIEQILPIMAIAMLALPTCALLINDDSSASGNESPTISDSGVVADKASFIWYARYCVNGYPLTNNSASVDTYDTNSGKSISNVIGTNTVYAILDGLDTGSQYYLWIEEKTGDTVNARICIALRAESAVSSAWITQIGGSPTVYVYTRGLTSIASLTAVDYSFNVGTNIASDTTGKTYNFYLISESGKTSATATAPSSATVLSSTSASNVGKYASFLECGVKDNMEMEDSGKLFGYAGDKKYQSGAVITLDPGKYVYAYFMTNSDTETFSIKQGDKTYDVPASAVTLSRSTASSVVEGYGYLVVNTQTLESSNIDWNSDFIVVMNEGSTELASSSVVRSSDAPDDENNTIYYVIGAVAIVLLIAATLYIKFMR